MPNQKVRAVKLQLMVMVDTRQLCKYHIIVKFVDNNFVNIIFQVYSLCGFF